MAGLTRAHGHFVPDMSDPPFACPPDIVLDLPPPPSVNRTRKVDWRGAAQYTQWQHAADQLSLANRASRIRIKGPFEAIVTLSDTLRLDLDNGIKAIIDYARRIELIENDSPRYFRRLTVQWGDAPEGCRLVLRGVA